MLNKVPHVTYVVESVEEMSAYLDRNFALKPIRRDEFTEQGFQSILYQVGETLVDFFEPLQDDTTMARQLRATGPDVMHVARGLNGIDKLVQDLKINGNEMRDDGPHTSRFGYKTISIYPNSSHRIYFQLAEGEHETD